jgi:hypothetical protein
VAARALTRYRGVVDGDIADGFTALALFHWFAREKR